METEVTFWWKLITDILLFNLILISYSFERLNLKAAAGKAKVFGTLIGIGGAMVLTFIKGVEIDIWPFHINLLHPHQHQNGQVATPHADSSSNLMGVLCAIASCFSYAFWLIIQVSSCSTSHISSSPTSSIIFFAFLYMIYHYVKLWFDLF